MARVVECVECGRKFKTHKDSDEPICDKCKRSKKKRG